MLGRPAAVLFDFGGTLDADGLPWSARFLRAYRALGGRLDAHDFELVFADSDRRLATHDGIAGLGLRATLDAQCRLLAPMLPDGAGVDWNAVTDALCREATETAARNARVLAALRPHVRLGVVSNFTGNLERCLDELGLLQFFGAVTDSAVVGRLKPSPELFVDTLRALGMPPERAWMVGDNFEADIRPALQLGLRACWLASPTRPAPPGCAPSVRIARLPELNAVLAHGAVCTD
jgi:putative hydrolase of the HAD superfamily